MPVSSQTGPGGRDIIFSLKVVNAPGNEAEGRKFSGAAGGRGGPGGGGRGPSSADEARAAREAEREAERIHKRHRERQLERAKRGREAREQEVADAKRAADEIDREEERLHRRRRQRQLERARENRRMREEERADAHGQWASGQRLIDDTSGYSGSRNALVARGFARSSAAANMRREGLMRAGSGIMDLGMAAAHSGLIGEKDQQTLINTLLGVSAARHGMEGVTKLGSSIAGPGAGLGAVASAGAAAAAALLSVAAAGKMAHEIWSGGASDTGSFTQRMGRFQEYAQRGMSWIAGGAAPQGQVYTAAYNAEQNTARMTKNQAAMMEQQARREALGGIDAGGADAMFEARMSALRGAASAHGGSEGVLRERMGLHDEQMAAEEAQRMAKTDAEREAAAQRILKIQERQVELAQHSAEVGRQEANEKLRAARESLSTTTQELAKRKEAMKAIEEKTMSAAERFGNLDDEEKAKTLRAGRIVSEARRARERGMTALASAKIRSLSKEDRERLSSLGLDSASEAARESAVAEARKKGFFDEFGGAEAAKFDAEREIARKLEVRLKREEEVVVKIEDNLEEITRTVINAVRAENDRRYELLRRQVQEDMDKQRMEVDRKIASAKRGAPGG